MSDLIALRRANTQRQREWDPACQIDPLFRAVELAGEVGEALNVVKKLVRQLRGLAGSTATKEQLADELADVIICADLVGADWGIDLGPAVERKFNSTSVKVGLKTRLVL